MTDKPTKLRILFVCDANRMRSPTAEKIFRADNRFDVKSAGVDRSATVTVDLELLEWADLIFVMEKRQRNIIRKRFAAIYATKAIVCLYIPDEYEYMDPQLIRLLLERTARFLPTSHGGT